MDELDQPNDIRQPTAQVMMDGLKWRHLNMGGRGLHTRASYQRRVSPIPALQHFPMPTWRWLTTTRPLPGRHTRRGKPAQNA